MSPVRSGVAASLAVAPETVYGTYVAPTTAYPFTSESLARENEYIRTAGLRAGRLSQSEALHVKTTHSAAGGFSLDFLTKGMGKMLNQLHGDTVVPIINGATTAYTQTHPIGLTDPFSKSLTVQVGRPDVGGTVRPFSYLGSKVQSAEFGLERGGVLTSEWTLDARDEDTATALATPTYAAAAGPFTFQQGSIELDDVVLSDCVRSASVSVSIPQETERYCINSSAVKAAPIQNGLTTVEASLEVEFASLSQHTAFVNSTRRKLELICTGALIAGAFNYKVSFTMASTVAVSSSPTVQGPDVLTQDVTLEALDNSAAAPLVVEYISVDTTL